MHQFGNVVPIEVAEFINAVLLELLHAVVEFFRAVTEFFYAVYQLIGAVLERYGAAD